MGESNAEQAKQGRGARDEAGSELVVLLKQHQEEIATAWAEMVQVLPGSFYRDLPPQEVRSLTVRGLEAIAESLETGSCTVLDEYLVDVCPVNSEAVPDASAVTEALLLCKDAAVPTFETPAALIPAQPGPWSLDWTNACAGWSVVSRACAQAR